MSVSARSALCLGAVLVVVALADGERHVAVLDHVLNLLAHGQDEKDNPVHDENGPENRHVEDLKPCADKGDDDGTSCPVPKLELGKSADKRLELFVAFCGKSADASVFHVILEVIVGGVKLGLQEGEEEIQEVDSEGVGNNIPPLCDKDANEKD